MAATERLYPGLWRQTRVTSVEQRLLNVLRAVLLLSDTMSAVNTGIDLRLLVTALLFFAR